MSVNFESTYPLIKRHSSEWKNQQRIKQQKQQDRRDLVEGILIAFAGLVAAFIFALPWILAAVDSHTDPSVMTHQNCTVAKISETDENNHISTSCGNFKISDKLVNLVSVGHRYDLQTQDNDVLNVTIKAGK